MMDGSDAVRKIARDVIRLACEAARRGEGTMALWDDGALSVLMSVADALGDDRLADTILRSAKRVVRIRKSKTA